MLLCEWIVQTCRKGNKYYKLSISYKDGWLEIYMLLYKVRFSQFLPSFVLSDRIINDCMYIVVNRSSWFLKLV